MQKSFRRVVSVLLCVALTVSVFCGTSHISAVSETQKTRNKISQLQKQSKDLQNEISRLKKDASQKKALLEAIQRKIANTQSQINTCNAAISSINAKINANKAEIKKKNQEIEADKLSFKKRLRAIYMSDSESQVQILLGADNFSEYLQLSQLTASVSKHDQALIEKLVAAIDVLNKKNAENEKLLNEQKGIKANIVAAQNQLRAEEAEAKALYNEVTQDQADAAKDKASVDAAIKKQQAYLKSLLTVNTAPKSFINVNTGFMWPVPGYYSISAGYQSNDSIHRGHHNGIDIAGGGIYGKPIVAITDGVVDYVYSGCPHRSKSPMCSCGSGYGNHVRIYHGSVGGYDYYAIYGHMDRPAVGAGQSVKKGDVIGYVGTTGNSTGYHLHFGLMRKPVGSSTYSWVNPYSYVR